MSSPLTTRGAVRKLWSILTQPQRRAAIILLALSLIGMVLETLGVGLVIPALALMTQRDIAVRYPAVKPALALIGHPTQERLVVMGMLTLVAVYAIKAMFLVVLAWRQMKFVYSIQAELSDRLFTSYLRQPYAFHLERNSAQLIRNAVTETNLFAQTLLMPGLQCLAETFVMVGIATLMLAVEPLGTIAVISALGAAVWVFHSATVKHIARWGAARQEHEGRRIQYLQQGLGGAKDVKLLGREEDFLRIFATHNEGYARVGRRFGLITQLPRLWLELLGVTGLATLVLVMIWHGRSVESILPALGLFAVGAFRLMPSANRVLGGLQNVRYGLPAIDVLYRELRELPAASPQRASAPIPFSDALVMDRVTYRYRGSERPSLVDVSLRIAHGTSVGFIGSTGAGKSTLVDVLLGLLSPEEGRVLVDGMDIALNPRGWQDRIGYVPQSIYLTDDTLRRNVAFGVPSDDVDEEAVWSAVRAARLEAMVLDLAAGLDTVVGERGIRLSGGQRQRIGIARALYHNPTVLVLDEATSALDTITEQEVMDTVRELRGNKTVIIVAHRLSTVQQCDRLYRLEGGRVVEEGLAEALLFAGASRHMAGAE